MAKQRYFRGSWGVRGRYTVQEQAVIDYMLRNWTDHIDDCGNVNETLLAEDAIANTRAGESLNANDTESVFELAFDVVNNYGLPGSES